MQGKYTCKVYCVFWVGLQQVKEVVSQYHPWACVAVANASTHIYVCIYVSMYVYIYTYLLTVSGIA